MANMTGGSYLSSEPVADGSRNTGLGKPLPHLVSDKEADAFVASADLSRYDLSVLVRTQFPFLVGKASL